MAAPMRILRIPSFLLLSRQFKGPGLVVNNTEYSSLCVTQKRLIHGSEERNKREKFNLSDQTRKRRRFRYEEKHGEKESNGRIQTFKLDSLADDYDDSRRGHSIRQTTIAETLKQAMKTLLDGSDVSPQLRDLNLEISEVKLAHDMGHVTFYWTLLDENHNKEDIERLLVANQDTIRLLLPSYHHLNISPRVVFSWDKHAHYLADIDSLLTASRQQQNED